MHMLYNSDSYVVVQFDGASSGEEVANATHGGGGGGGDGSGEHIGSGGLEVVDKFLRKEIFLVGAVAESFKRGVQALVDKGPDDDALDDFIATYTLMAHHPVVLH